MSRIKMALVPTRGPAAGRYRLQIFPTKSKTYEEFLEYCTSSSSTTKADVKKVIQLQSEWLRQCAAAGETCSLGELGRSRISAKGAFDHPAEDLKALNFEYNLTWVLSPQLKKEAREAGQRLLRERVAIQHVPIIIAVEAPLPDSSGKRRPNAWQAGKLLYVHGRRLQFDPQRSDEGVFLRPVGSKGAFIRAATHQAGPKMVACDTPDALKGSGPVRLQVRRRHLPHEDDLLMTEYDVTLQEFEE